MENTKKTLIGLSAGVIVLSALAFYKYLKKKEVRLMPGDDKDVEYIKVEKKKIAM